VTPSGAALKYTQVTRVHHSVAARGHHERVAVILEVVVSGPASVFVRELSPEEAQKLRRVSRQSKVFALRRRV
jgi:hypothetical protein